MVEEVARIEGLDLDIDQRRLVDLVYRRLREAVQDGRIVPGQRLVQDDLAKQFGTSRSPVREAIVRLAEEGLVTIEPHRGAFVRELTVPEMDQIYEVRLILEPYAASKAARLATAEAIEHLADLQREAEGRRSEMDVAELFRLNGSFHRSLIAPCGNGILASSLDKLWERQVAFSMFAQYTEIHGAVDEMLREHAAILSAYRDREHEVVRALVEDHIRGSWRSINPVGGDALRFREAPTA